MSYCFEFFSGSANGVVVPFDTILVVGGVESAIADTENGLIVLEFGQKRFTFECDGEHLYLLSDLSDVHRKKRISMNRIFSLSGVDVAIYKAGTRRVRRLTKDILRQNALRFSVFFLVPMFSLAVTSFFITNKFSKQLLSLEGAYIKHGSIYIAEDVIEKQHWFLYQFFDIIKPIDTGLDYGRQVSVKDAFDNSTMPHVMLDTEGDLHFVVESYKNELLLVSWLLEYETGIKYGEELYEVNKDIYDELVSRNFDEKILQSYLVVAKDESLMLDKGEFNYRVFYSENRTSYIYSNEARYWVGAYVPDIGILENIEKDRVSFSDGDITKYILTKDISG